MSNVTGNNKGVEVWNKLGHSKDTKVQEYFSRLLRFAPVTRRVFFCDFEEQLKRKLNNQDLYSLTYSDSDEKWHIALFQEKSTY
jgi:hypothetical protein